MGRKSSRELVGNIAKALTTEPQSIQDIANAVDADRQSVTKYLEELTDAGIVKEEKTGRSRKFYVSEYEENDSYFGLPLNQEQKNKFKVLFKKIFRNYREQFDTTPSKLMSQKIAVKVIKELNLDLPYGRYQYGSITAMSYTPGDGNDIGPVDFGPDFNEDTLDQKIEETVTDFGTRGFDEARKKQYEDENMELYLLKEDLMEDLAGDIEDNSEFQRKLYQFLAKTPELDNKVDEALVDFVAISTDLLNEASHRAKAIQTFQEFWELIAFYCLQEDLSNYYPEETLEHEMSDDREEKWHEVEEALTELILLHKKVTEIPNVDEDLKELQGSTEELSDEEQKQRKEDLENMDSSDLSGEFGLDS